MPMPEEYEAEKQMEYWQRVVFPSAARRQGLLAEMQQPRRDKANKGQPGLMAWLRWAVTPGSRRSGRWTAVRRPRSV